MHEMQYSLGLLLAERKNYQDASLYLSMAARGIPGRGRVHYNLGMLMDFLRKDVEAEAALQKALAISPDNAEYLTALAQFYLKRGKYREAEPFAKRLSEAHPTHPAGREMREFIHSRIPNEKK